MGQKFYLRKGEIFIGFLFLNLYFFFPNQLTKIKFKRFLLKNKYKQLNLRKFIENREIERFVGYKSNFISIKTAKHIKE